MRRHLRVRWWFMLSACAAIVGLYLMIVPLTEADATVPREWSSFGCTAANHHADPEDEDDSDYVAVSCPSTTDNEGDEFTLYDYTSSEMLYSTSGGDYTADLGVHVAPGHDWCASYSTPGEFGGVPQGYWGPPGGACSASGPPYFHAVEASGDPFVTEPDSWTNDFGPFIADVGGFLADVALPAFLGLSVVGGSVSLVRRLIRSLARSV